MKGSANRGRTRLDRSTGAHLNAGAFCCLTAWTGPVWVPRNPSCSWCGVGRRALAQTGPRAVISAHIQASIVNPVFVEHLVRFVHIYLLRYGLSFQASYLNIPTMRGTGSGPTRAQAADAGGGERMQTDGRHPGSPDHELAKTRFLPRRQRNEGNGRGGNFDQRSNVAVRG